MQGASGGEGTPPSHSLHCSLGFPWSLSKNSLLDTRECSLLPNSPPEAAPAANAQTLSLGWFYKSSKINLSIGFQYVGAFLLNSFHFFLQGNDPVVCNCKLLIKLEKQPFIFVLVAQDKIIHDLLGHRFQA